MSGASDDGWEDRSWGVIAAEASLDHTGSIVYHKGGHFLIITHRGGLGLWYEGTEERARPEPG